MDTKRSTPLTLIGLPYHLGDRPRGHGHEMALGPHVLLADDAVPALMREAFTDVEKVWLDDLDEASARDFGDDPRLLPPGDQMVRQLVQSSGLSRAVSAAIADGRFPVVSAGNCNTALGMVGGVDDESIGMIWFDAHADANTPETTSNGMFEGMPVAVIAGRCYARYRAQIPGFHVVPEDRIVTVGNHEVYSSTGRGPGFGAAAIGRVVDPPVIAAHGFTRAMTEAIVDLASRTRRVYVHIDTDVIDDSILRANRHASDGGLTPEQIVEAIGIIADHLEIAAVNFTAYDPTVDPGAAEILTRLVRDVAVAATPEAP